MGESVLERNRGRVVAVMAVRNRRALTVQSIRQARTAAAVAKVDLRWVVFDDGSTDGTSEALTSALASGDHVIQGDGTAYWAGGMRTAMHFAMDMPDLDYLLMLNDDTMLFPDALQNLKVVADTGEMTIAVGTLVAPGTANRTYGGAQRMQKLRPLRFQPVPQAPMAPVDVMNANAVLLTRAAFRRLGPLRQPFTHALADYDYALHANRRGVRVVLAADTVGECELNLTTAEWLNERLSLRERWRVFCSPKGLPPREWAVYCFRHAAFAAPIYFILPVVRMLLVGRRTRWRAP